MPWMRRPFNDPVADSGYSPMTQGVRSDVSDVSADRRFPLEEGWPDSYRDPPAIAGAVAAAVTSTVTMLTARAPMLIHSAAHAGSEAVFASKANPVHAESVASGRTLTCSVGTGPVTSFPRAPPCSKRCSNGP